MDNTEKNNVKFWHKIKKESSHIESPESQRRRMRIKISDVKDAVLSLYPIVEGKLRLAP